MTTAVEQRFHSKYEVRWETGCWVWTGGLSNGYGRLYAGSRSVYAHRYAHELVVGPIPEGLQIDHLCRIRRCVNPAHMEPVTQAENIRRGAGYGNGLWKQGNHHMSRRSHCKAGHLFDAENTHQPDPNGRRYCRACRRAKERADRKAGRRR